MKLLDPESKGVESKSPSGLRRMYRVCLIVFLVCVSISFGLIAINDYYTIVVWPLALLGMAAYLGLLIASFFGIFLFSGKERLVAGITVVALVVLYLIYSAVN